MQGVSVLEVKNVSPSTAREDSNTTIAVIGTAVIEGLDDAVKSILISKNNILYFDNVDSAIAIFKTIGGTIREDLEDIKAQNVLSPIILSIVPITQTVEDDGTTPQSFYGTNEEIKTALVNAVDNLRYVRTIYATRVDIIVAGWWTWDLAVRDKVNALSEFLDCIGLVDLNETNITSANAVLESLGSTRYLAFPFFRRVWSIYKKAEMKKPNSAIVAGHISVWDAKLGEFGYCFDHANRAIFSAGKCIVDLDYQEGKACGVNNLVDKGACLIVNDDGDKLYNFETTSDDERFNKLELVRTFIGLNRNLQANLKKYKHRPIDSLTLIKVDVEDFLNSVKLSGGLVGFKVEFGSQNTSTTLSEGKLYIDYYISNVPGIRELILQPFATNEFYSLGDS